MTAERPQNDLPYVHDSLRPMEQVFIATGHIIDQIGYPRTTSDGLMIEAEWVSEEMRFLLQDYPDAEGTFDNTYKLRVFNEFEHGKAKEFYSYGTLTKKIEIRDEKWRIAKSKRKRQQTTEQVLGYLQTAPVFLYRDDKEFMNIMERSDVQDFRLSSKLRRFARGVFKGL